MSVRPAYAFFGAENKRNRVRCTPVVHYQGVPSRAGLAAFAKYGAIIVALDSNYPSRGFIARERAQPWRRKARTEPSNRILPCLAYLSASTLPPRLHLLPLLTRFFLRQSPLILSFFSTFFLLFSSHPSFLQERCSLNFYSPFRLLRSVDLNLEIFSR